MSLSTAASASGSGPAGGTLKRRLTTWHVVLYGLGVTIGAGIYVLIGPAALRAGMTAPTAFVIAALVMGLTATSFAELGTRLPVAAGEAAYIAAGFRSDRIGLLAGLLVIAIAVISAAAVSLGSTGYIRVFLPVPEPLVLTVVVVAMGLIAAWGIEESVTFAAAMTLVEIGGLLIVVGTGLVAAPGVIERLPEALPGTSAAQLGGLAAATLIAVFAFIGFEGIVNVAEEMRDPRRTLPVAIFLTLVITTVLYVLVMWVALVTIPPAELARSTAPLADVYSRLTGQSPRMMSAIAIIATLNGIIVQIIMAARVIYGLSRKGHLPARLARVGGRTGTPLTGTLLVTLLVLVLALALPLDRLADLTARVTLVLFVMVNVALIRLKARETMAPPGIFLAPRWVPVAGAIASGLCLVADLLL